MGAIQGPLPCVQMSSSAVNCITMKNYFGCNEPICNHLVRQHFLLLLLWQLRHSVRLWSWIELKKSYTVCIGCLDTSLHSLCRGEGRVSSSAVTYYQIPVLRSALLFGPNLSGSMFNFDRWKLKHSQLRCRHVLSDFHPGSNIVQKQRGENWGILGNQ